jgi:hypothetical protein
MTFILFMVTAGIATEAIRAVVLRRRHGMTLRQYYERRARGEDVPMP